MITPVSVFGPFDVPQIETGLHFHKDLLYILDIMAGQFQVFNFLFHGLFDVTGHFNGGLIGGVDQG